MRFINNKIRNLISIISLIVILALFWGHYGLPEPELPVPRLETQQIIRGAEPVFWENNTNKAVLLIHGFMSTPQSLEYLGTRLYNKGYTVIIPLLPGHGTNYDNLEKTRFYHWYEEAYIYAVLYRKKYKHFHIVGLSMGGSITLKLLEELPEHLLPDSAALISAPVFLNKLSFGSVNIYDWRLFFSGIIKFFYSRIPDTILSKEELDIIPEITYQGFHVPACVHSLKIALHSIDKNLFRVKIPVFIIQAERDKIVPDKNLEYIYKKVSSVIKNKYFLNLPNDKITRRHTITLHRDTKEIVAQKIINFINRF